MSLFWPAKLILQSNSRELILVNIILLQFIHRSFLNCLLRFFHTEILLSVWMPNFKIIQTVKLICNEKSWMLLFLICLFLTLVTNIRMGFSEQRFLLRNIMIAYWLNAYFHTQIGSEMVWLRHWFTFHSSNLCANRNLIKTCINDEGKREETYAFERSS